MDRWKGRVALVTGASAGIGAAIAERLVTDGMTVIGCARNTAKIQDLSDQLRTRNVPGRLIWYQCDVSDEKQILAMFAEIRTQYGGVDVCINNAGLAHTESLLNGQTDKWIHMFMVNVIGLSICSREAVKSMRERNVDDGHILNINSLAGHNIPPDANYHFYAATKHAVKALTIGVRNELRRTKSNIRISAISPGEVKTEFAYRMYPGRKATVDGFFSKIKALTSEDVAETVAYTLSCPAHMEVQDMLIRGKI